MRFPYELQASMARHRSEIDQIIATAESEARDLTELEAKRAAELQEQIQADAAAIPGAEIAETRMKDRMLEKHPDFAAPGGVSGGMGASDKWQVDSRGNRYAMVAKDERVADLYGRQPKNALGHFIGAKLFGAGRSTPESIRMALSTESDALGGFLVPDQLSAQVFDLARARSVVMQSGATTAVMNTKTITIPKLLKDVDVEIKAENAPGTFSDLEFGAVEMTAMTAFAGTKMSRELWEDSQDLMAQQLESWLSAAMAAQVDKWALSGSGTGEPLGLLNMTGIPQTAGIGDIDWVDLAAAANEVRLRNYEPNAAILNTQIYSDLLLTETGDGTGAARGWLGRPPALEGLNIQQTTHAPLASGVVGDFSKLLVGIRSAARVEVSTVAGDAFERHQVWAKVTMRFAIETLTDDAFQRMAGLTSPSVTEPEE